MAETDHNSSQYSPIDSNIQFGEEMEIEESGFSFRPIEGFELEMDDSVYMYSEDGNLEINLVGGELEDQVSIAEFNDELAAEFLENVDDFKLRAAGTETIQGITGFLNDIRFFNAEEEGLGRALICSPYINQYFFMVMIASADYWHLQGEKIFEALKSQIHFHSQFTSDEVEKRIDQHRDLTIESCETIETGEDFTLKIEKGDVSFLLAAQSYNADVKIALTQIITPSGKHIYHYDPQSETFSSDIFEQNLSSDHGEICLFYTSKDQDFLQPGPYRFSFTTQDEDPIQEVQAIIRSGPINDSQLLDINLWLATENGHFYDPDFVDQFEKDLAQALKKQMAPLNISPGKIECFHPAPDELSAFNTVNIETDLADCSYMIAETVNNDRALNIGLVDHLTTGDPPQKANLQAVSSGSPGMILSHTSPHACIIIGWSQYHEDIEGLSKAIIQQMLIFSGIDIEEQDLDIQSLSHKPELLSHLRRHPLFYNAD